MSPLGDYCWEASNPIGSIGMVLFYLHLPLKFTMHVGINIPNYMGILWESLWNRLFQPPRTLSTGDLFVGLRNNPQLSAALAAGDEAVSFGVGSDGNGGQTGLFSSLKSI